MYQLSTPNFRFVVFLVEESRFKNSNNTQQTQTQTTCYADTYEVNSDGSITFYQIGLHSGKRVKVPVLTYPNGKWTGIVLVDDHNQFPVFNGSASFNNANASQVSQAQFNSSGQNNSINRQNENRSERTSDKADDMPNLTSQSLEEDGEQKHDYHSQMGQQTEKTDDDLDSVIDLFDENGGNNTGSNNQSQHSNQSNNSNTWNRGSQSHGNSPHMPNKGIPGISQNMNPNDFKKAKNELLETQIKDYVKYNPLFNLEEVVTAANKESRAKKLGNISDTDVIWVASSLIREKTVQTRKFVEPVIQKNLSHMLPDIMRRQWSGKMGPILQVLEEREETKNVTAIDLAVWMVQNNFE